MGWMLIAGLIMAAAPAPHQAPAYELRYWTRSIIRMEDGQMVPIRTRVRVSPEQVVTENWLESVGEAAGLRRMTITATDGWRDIRGQREQLTPKKIADEQIRFNIYREMQPADRWCRAQPRRGEATARFGVSDMRCAGRVLVGAVNWLGTVCQEVRFHGLLRSNGAVFPRRLKVYEDGQLVWDMDVQRFEAVRLNR